MKRSYFALTMLFLAILGGKSATAAIVVDDIFAGQKVKLDYASSQWARSGSGGPFLATPQGGNSFLTFCVEPAPFVEYFQPGVTYTVYSMDPRVASLTGNTISEAGKWLYYQFRAGATLDLGGGTTLDLSSASNGGIVQDVIWAETSHNGSALRTFSADSDQGRLQTYVENHFVVAEADCVAVFNPGPGPAGYQGDAQSMLCLVPEPTTFLVWAGLFGLLVVARVRRGLR
jgi:hypothetical protein